jgi:hypothetical protein
MSFSLARFSLSFSVSLLLSTSPLSLSQHSKCLVFIVYFFGFFQSLLLSLFAL